MTMFQEWHACLCVCESVSQSEWMVEDKSVRDGCVYACTFVCVYMCVHLCLWMWMYDFKCLNIHAVCVCACMCVCVCVHAYTFVSWEICRIEIQRSDAVYSLLADCSKCK